VLAGAFSATKANSSDPHLNLAAVVFGSLIAAIVGAQIGYYLGRRFGTRLFKDDARIFKTAYLDRAQEFFHRRGSPSVVLARFVPVVRTIVPMLAGATRMRARTFAIANLIGDVAWPVGISLLGDWLGRGLSIE